MMQFLISASLLPLLLLGKALPLLTQTRPNLLAQKQQVTQSTVLLQEQGTLQRGDQVLSSDGSLYDSFAFVGRAGQTVTLLLESNEFDTYIGLVDPSGDVIAGNDDISSRNTNSTITINLTRDGEYIVFVNGFDRNSRGRYLLTITEPSMTMSTTEPVTQSNHNCNEVLQNAVSRIEQGRNIQVDVERFDITARYENAPRNYPVGYTFSMLGGSSEDVMRSPQFMTTISQDVITNCDSVGLVQFHLDQSDWVITFGLMNGNRVVEFQCIEPGHPLGRQWGYTPCA